MLNLERIEMSPAGLERGELLATIPLAPKERTSVVQKEWSHHSGIHVHRYGLVGELQRDGCN
jgi:hypothetical protein